MKYVMFEVSICEIGVRYLPIIFPDILVHRYVAGSMMPQLRAIFANVKVISAGEYDPATGKCYGKSETLGVASRPLLDNDIIAAFNTAHGKV
jgi:hypothetical protein